MHLPYREPKPIIPSDTEDSDTFQPPQAPERTAAGQHQVAIMTTEYAKITPFSGKGGDVNRFIKKVRLSFLGRPASQYQDAKDREDAKVMLLEEHLTGNALLFFNRLPNEVKDS